MDGPLLSPDVVSTILWVLFLASALLATALGAILTYHWLKYVMGGIVPMVALASYTTGCLFFLLIMFAAAMAS